MLGRLTRHTATVDAQAESGEPTVEHATGVVDLSVAHEMKAVGGHDASLRAGSVV